MGFHLATSYFAVYFVSLEYSASIFVMIMTRDNMEMVVPRAFSREDLWTELCDITGEESHMMLTAHMHTIILHLLPAIATNSPALRQNRSTLEKCTNVLAQQNILV